MHCTRERVLASMPDEVPSSALDAYRGYLARRNAGEPIAYLLGYREFYGRRFAVDSRVLVPRPETELLVDIALSALSPPVPPPSAGTPSRQRYHDAFTGSGCVGISIAAERPELEVSLSDASPDALEVASANAVSVLGHELSIGTGSILSAATGVFDVITANPPYVSSTLTDALLSGGSHEPRMALDGGPLGLDPYPALAEQAWAKLREGGVLIVEIGEEQGAAVTDIFKAAGFDDVRVEADLAGQDRCVVGVKHA